MHISQHCRSISAITFTLCLLISGQANALSVDLGVSFSQPVLELKTKDDEVLGKNAAQTSVWPSISLQSKERYLGNSNWGYSISAMAWYFSMDKQKEKGSDKLIDYDTSMKGYFAYLVPTFYYRIGDKYIMEGPDQDRINWTFGIGLGVGYLHADGTTYTNYSSTPTTEDIHIDNAAFSSGFFIEGIRNRWFIRFSSFGPEVPIENSRKVRLNDNSVMFGIRYDLSELF